MDELRKVLSAHADYEEISMEAYMDAWDGGQPLLDLLREQDSCRVFVNAAAATEDEFVMDVSPGSRPGVHYRIAPSDDIVASLEVLERAGFEHINPEPLQPGESPFQRVFDAIEQAGRSDER